MKKYKYFTGKILIILVVLLGFHIKLQGQTTLYSYKTGAWNDIDTWTTDPGGTTLVGSQIPTNGDIVVILSSRTVTLTNDTATTNLDITIKSGGVLDIGNYSFTSGLAALKGSGKLKLSATNFPSISGTKTFIESGGGTTEYYNSSNFELPSVEYNNLTLNLSTTSIVASQLANIIVNGNLYIKVGTYQLNDATATRLQLTIGGDITVDSGSSLLTGTGNTTSTTNPVANTAAVDGGTAPFLNYYDQNTHRVTVYGNFTNNGTVKFTNQSYPDYNSFPTNGAATVYFLGATDNILTCNNTTDFYNLVVDKGSDQTFQLSINSSDYYNFRLFGANIAGGENGGDNPDLKKALWIRNGTLRLFGKVVIPSLSEGSCGDSGANPNTDFYIPANAALVVDGPDVILLTTADSYTEINAAYGTSATSNTDVGLNSSAGCSSFSILGKFQIDDGYVSTRESGGFIYWASSSGEFIVNGGILDTKQFRTANASGGLTAYRQTGGTFNLRGRIKNDISSVSTVADLASVPLSYTQSTGGIQSAVGTFNVDRDDNIFEMTGGEIKIYDVCGESGTTRAFEVNSLPAYYNVSGGTVYIIPTDGSRIDETYYVASSAPIYNFIVDDSDASGFVTTLTDIPSKSGVTARNNPPLTILNDLTISNNATLNASNYDVKIAGDFNLPSGTFYNPGTNNTVFNGSSYQTFTGGGTIDSGAGFYKLKIEKSADTLLMAGAPTSYTVQDSLQIIDGVLNDNAKTINVEGNIYNGGIHTGTGKIVLNGSGTQYLEQTVFGSASLGNLELDNGTDPGAQLLSDLNASTLTLTPNGGTSLFDIQSYELSLTGGVVQTSGTFGSSVMVRTSGAISGKGLTVSLALTGASSPDFLFPVGVDNGGTNEYAPFELLTPGDAGTTTGNLNVVPVNDYHPSVTNTSRVIQFYWKVDAGGFAGAVAGQMQYRFTYFGVPIPNNQNKACYLGPDEWLESSGAVNRTTGVITFPTGLGFLSTSFTAGNQSAFNAPRVLYSKTSGNWNLSTTWSAVSHSSTDDEPEPNSYDKVIIGGTAGVNHTVTVVNNNEVAASVTILGSFTGDDNRPTLSVGTTTGHDFTSVDGNGRFVIASNNLPNADFGDFCNQDTAVFEYTGANINTLPSSLAVYPNLYITADATANRVKVLPNSNILVNGNLLLSTASSGNTLRLNSGGGSLTVYGDVLLDNNSNLEFDGSTSQTLKIYGNLDLNYDDVGTDVNYVSVNSGTASHQISFYGDSIITGASLINIPNGTLNVLDSLNTVITDGTGSISLNRLTINKDNLTDNVTFSENFTLNGSTNSSPKALTLTQGTLILENTNTNIELTSGGSDFNIPQEAALVLKNGASVNVIGSGYGIFLDGLLSAEGTSAIDLGDGSTGDTRYIEYSGSGNAEIILSGSATLDVNSQIRRSLSQTNGVLKYSQSESASTTIYGRGGSATRAKFEVVNSGSEFYMTGGTFTIIRGGGTSFGDLYLRPESGSSTGGTITLGSVDVGVQTIKFDATIPLNSLVLDGVNNTNTFQLMVNPLVMNGDLTINTANSIFDANNINVTLKGDLTNNGTYIPGSNTTTFNGSTQSILGSTVTDFYNLVSEPSTSLTFNYDVSIANDLSINSGTLFSSTYDIFVGGNFANNGIHSGDASQGGIILNGSVQQQISGTGTFGRLNLYNSNGSRLLNNITLNQDLLLSDGIFNINQYLLTLGTDADIIDTVGTGFSSSKMIEPDGVFSNIGIKKNYTGGADTIIYPLGVSGKYTPATVEIIASSSGSIRVNCINDNHPTVLDDTEVLQYYWEIESSGISSFEGELKLKYDNGDVAGTESDYVAARLVIPDGTSWSKATPGSDATDNVYEATDTIDFTFPAGTDNLSGEYTAGSDAAIPSIVPTYVSNSSGDWDDVNIWTPVSPAGGPNGFIVEISSGDSVNTNGNRRFAYKTTINGVLDVGSSYGHNLGTVDGTGRLRVENQVLPAGRFTSFLSCSGGTLEYGGTGSYTIIADRLDTLRNLYFTGSGTRTLPDKDLVICDTLKIDGVILDNSINNRKLTINGVFQRLNTGVFTSGSGANATVVFAGSVPQTIGGVDGEFTGVNKFNNFGLNNSSGLTLNSPLEINEDLLLTDGIITTTSTNILKILNPGATSTVTPDGGSSLSYIDGPLSIYIYGGNDFNFPLGDGTRYGKLQLLGVDNGTWVAQYVNSGYGDYSVTGSLTEVSQSEYWIVDNPAAGDKAQVKLRWDSSSDITPLTTTNGINDIVVAEFDNFDWVDKTSDAPVGNDYNGTVNTSTTIDIDPTYYTLGSTSAILAKAYFTILDDVCAGDDISVSFSGVDITDLNFTLSYSIDGVDQADLTVTSLTYVLTTTSSGVYRINGFTYNGGTIGAYDTSPVNVNAVPSQPTITPVDGDPSLTFCEGGSVILTSSVGDTYLWSTGATTQNINVTMAGNYTVQVINAAGCASIASAVKTVTVNSAPVFTPSAVPATICFGESSQLDANISGAGYSYIWSPSGELDASSIQNPVYTPITNPTSPTQITTTFSVTVTDSNSCSDVETIDVTLNRTPETGPEYHIDNTWGL